MSAFNDEQNNNYQIGDKCICKKCPPRSANADCADCPGPKLFCLNKSFPKQALVFTCLRDNSFENTAGKGAISPFPTVFSTLLEKFLPFSSTLKLLSASKICRLGKG